MKQIVHKIASFSLALIVLFSSLSFTVNKHICGGEVVNTTLFVSADTCGMEMDICKNELQKDKQTTSVEKEPCCKDTMQVVQGNDTNQQAQQMNLDIAQVQFIATFVYSFVLNYQLPTNTSKIVDYSPPPLVRNNIQSLFQVFII